MKNKIGLEISSFRWWAIIIIIFSALILFVIYDYNNIKNLRQNPTISIEKIAQLEPAGLNAPNMINNENDIFTPVIIRASIGLALAFSLLFLLGNKESFTAKRQSGTNLQNKENYLPYLLDGNLPFGIAIWCNQGKLIACNSQYRNKLNLPLEITKAGANYVDIMGEIKSNNGYKIVSDEELVRQIEIVNNKNETIFIDERPLGNGGFISIINDISEKVNLQKQLKKSQNSKRKLTRKLQQEAIKAQAASRSKTAFLAHLSHDVRTPLTHIIGFAELISHQPYGPIGDERYLSYINDIKRSGDKLLMSFTEILELAQLEAGDLRLKPENVKFEHIILNVANRFKARAKKAKIKLDVNVCDETILHVDRMCCERMISNIVENAIQFTPKGGKVNINAFSADDGVVLEISDNGIGMSAERIADLNQPFVLGDAAFTREGGMGLGIAISRAIAELNGGELAIDSTPSIGTTVAISLPVKASKESKHKKAA